MTLNETQRRYLADICGKMAEFVVSILLIGQLVANRFNGGLFAGAVLFAGWLIVTGTWLTGAHPSQGKESL